MRMYDLIMKKRNGGMHTEEEIKYIVSNFTNGSIPDYQMSAWLMCVYYKGMNNEETVWLTKAMANSGDMLDLSKINGVKVDKHSTGGVGDKTTFIVAPILASLGVPIAKMSGRGLGHTGGTIDKLESIEGFNVAIPEEEFINNVNKNKLALVSQTGNLAPADKKIYALRDVTATVDSLPLIASSIMSKKLAAGADVIVLDVKCGSGAFMKNEEDAKKLAQIMVDIGNMAGKKTYGIITDMNEPLGCKVGNSLEVEEAIDVLKLKDLSDEGYNNLPKGIKRLLEVSLTLASYMLMGAGKAKDFQTAKGQCEEAITSGKALDKFATFVENQGGNKSMILEEGKLPKASIVKPVAFSSDGYISACETSEVGMANLILGGGRATKESVIDLSVGIDIRKHIGDYVSSKEPFAYIYGNDEKSVEEAEKRLLGAYTISKEKVEASKIIKYIIE
ncbi:MAG: pyrimidine-nucleoside phosphorylase [Lachnospiraceae bacterium]|nr:pyrimidine-nucleoside phosphorylase [Lachnospiraceae bacterium]